LGFAIPIETAQRVAEQLIAKGKVDHPYVGIRMVTLSKELRDQINQDPNSGMMITTDQGVLIGSVMQGSPAERAGLRAGDVIVRINGQPIKTADEVQSLVEKAGVGNSLRFEVSRSNQIQSVTVRTGSVPIAAEPQ